MHYYPFLRLIHCTQYANLKKRIRVRSSFDSQLILACKASFDSAADKNKNKLISAQFCHGVKSYSIKIQSVIKNKTQMDRTLQRPQCSALSLTWPNFRHMSAT